MKLTFQIEGQLAVVNCAVSGSGDRIVVGFDEKRNEYTFHITRYRKLDIPFEREIPGRLYVNKKLIPLRSELERLLIEKLKTAKYFYVPDVPPNAEAFQKAITLGSEAVQQQEMIEEIQSMTASIIDFVESDEYVDVAKKTGFE